MRPKLILVGSVLGLAVAIVAERPAAPPKASVREIYLQAVLERDCLHRPERCQSLDQHEMQIELDAFCHDNPRCQHIKDCLSNLIERAWGSGNACTHTPKCGNALEHFNTDRAEAGYRPLAP